MALEVSVRLLTAWEILREFRSLFEDIERQVKLYYQIKDSDVPAAIEHGKNALTKAYNLKDRISYWVEVNSVSDLNEVLNVIDNTITASDINDEYDAMITYCDNIQSQIEAETMTWDEGMATLAAKYNAIVPTIKLVYRPGFTDKWGR